MIKYTLLLILSLTSFAQVGDNLSEEERRAREELINKYGNREQITIVDIKEEMRIKIDNLSSDISELKIKFNKVNKTLKNVNISSQIMDGLKVKSEELDDLETRLNDIDEILQETGSPSKIKEQKVALDSLESEIYNFQESFQDISSSVDSHNDDLEKQLENFPKDILGKQGEAQLDENMMTKYMDDAMKSALARFKTDSPFKNMSRDEIRTFVTSSAGMTAIGRVIKSSPTFVDILVEIFHDKEAMPKLVTLVEKQKQMKAFFYISISLFILSMVLNMLNKKGNIFKRILKRILITVCMLCLNLSIFYYMFQEEVGPSVKAIARVLL